MRIRYPGRTILAAAVALGFAAGAGRPAHAAFTFTVAEVGNDVVVTGSGTLDLGGLTKQTGSTLNTNILWSDSGYLARIDGNYDVYSGITGPTNFGTASFAFATSASGDTTGVYNAGAQIVVPAGYASGAALSNSMTFAGESLASLGLTPGTHVWSWLGVTGGVADTFTIEILQTVEVPEPATALLLGAGLLGLVAVRRRA